MNKLLIVIIALLLLLMITVGVGAFIMLNGKTAPHRQASVEDGLPTQIITLDPITLNLADSGDGRYLRTTVALGVQGVGKVEEFGTKYKPKLMDTLIDVLTRRSYNELHSTEGKEAAKKMLTDTLNDRLRGSGWEVKEVLFTDFVME